MKRIRSFLLALLLLTLLTIPANASSYAGDAIEGEIALETIVLGGKEITVPTIVQDMNLSPYCLEGGKTYGQTVTYCIPATEEAVENNEYLIQSISSAISRPTTDTFPFLDGYLMITTSIFYSYRPAQEAPYTADFNYQLEGVSIDRNRGPGGLNSPLWGISGDPKVEVHIYGGQEYGGPMFQEHTYSLNWGLEKDISSDFNMVVRSSISHGYAEFTFDIINSSGTTKCVCPHHYVV